MAVVSLLKAILQLVAVHCVSTKKAPSKEECSRLCMTNETCFRFWFSPEDMTSRRYNNRVVDNTNLSNKNDSCLRHPGYKLKGPGLCLKYITSTKTWPAANKTCWAEGASLVKIDSEEKNTFLTKNFGPMGFTWLGGNDRSVEGRWLWTDGTPVHGFLDWVGGEPDGGLNQNCMFLFLGGWGNGGCSDSSKSFLCEIRLS